MIRMHRWKGVPRSGTAARHEGRCSSALCQGESPLYGRTARIPRVTALWAQEGEGRGLRSSSGVGECSQTPDHVEDMDDMLLAHMAKLAQR